MALAETAVRPPCGTLLSSRDALSGAGGPCDQHGPRGRPTPGAVALRRRKKRSRYSRLRDKSQQLERSEATTLGAAARPLARSGGAMD